MIQSMVRNIVTIAILFYYNRYFDDLIFLFYFSMDEFGGLAYCVYELDYRKPMFSRQKKSWERVGCPEKSYI